MEIGSYKGRRVDFGDYTTSCFTPYIFSDPSKAYVGCGPTALALLTGVMPEIIAPQNRSGRHTPDQFMVRFLRKRGFKVLKLTQCNLSASRSKLGSRHVVLLSQLFREGEATWGVLAGGAYYHNFDLYTLDSLSLLRKPVVSAYLVVHARWRAKLLVQSPLPKAGNLTLKSMGFKESFLDLPL